MTAENTGTLQQFRLDTKQEFNRGYWQGILNFADLKLDME